MRCLIAGGCGALALAAAGAVGAADLPVSAPPAPAVYTYVYNWAGLYLGVNGGWATAHNCWKFFMALASSEGCHSPNGGAVGGQIGFNWQGGPWVLGAELSGDWASLNGSSNSALFVAPQITNRTRVDAIGAVTGRVGYAWNAALLYIKGGGALADDKYDTRNAVTGILTGSATGARIGWTVGAGFEYGFLSNWTVALQYDHYDFGDENVGFGAPLAPNHRISQTVETITARLNWRLGWNNPY